MNIHPDKLIGVEFDIFYEKGQSSFKMFSTDGREYLCHLNDFIGKMNIQCSSNNTQTVKEILIKKETVGNYFGVFALAIKTDLGGFAIYSKGHKRYASRYGRKPTRMFGYPSRFEKQIFQDSLVKFADVTYTLEHLKPPNFHPQSKDDWRVSRDYWDDLGDIRASIIDDCIVGVYCRSV